jgi:membrane associated rhomboid family serine protease
LFPLRDNIPTDRFAAVTLAIIVLNVIVFLFLQHPSFSGEQVDTKTVVEYGAIPYRVTHPSRDCELARVPAIVQTPAGPAQTTEQQVVCQGTPEYRRAQEQREIVKVREAPAFATLFTSMFMHGGWLHIFFNMLFLWIFGNNVEDSMGRVRFVIFYLLGGLAAVLAQIAVDPNSISPTVGASGAIAAVLGAYLVLYPRARVLTAVFVIFFFFFVEIPAMVMLGIWFLLQFLPAVGQLASPEIGGAGGVAYFAHVGGFLFGLALIRLFATRRSAEYGRPRFPVY